MIVLELAVTVSSYKIMNPVTELQTENGKVIFGFCPHVLYTCCFPVSTLNRATIDPPAKRHPNGVSLAGR